MNYRFLLLSWLVWLGFATDLFAQTPVDSCTRTTSSNQPPAAFEAYDVGTGQRLDAFCQGQFVRFAPNPARNLPATVVVLYDTTRCSNPTGRVFTITSRPGRVSVYENAQNSDPTAPSGTLYVRRYAVYGTPKPVVTARPCSAGIVEVTIAAPNSPGPKYNRYSVRVGNGPLVSNVQPGTTSYPIPAGAPTTVTVTGSYDAVQCTGSETVSFTPLPAPQVPTIQRLTVRSGNLDFQFAALQPEFRYELQVASGTTYTTLATLPTSSGPTFTLPSATLPGRYRLRLVSPCQINTLDYPSAPVATTTLRAVSTNSRNVLKWTFPDSASASRYEITRDGQRLAIITGPSRYVDTLVSCGTTYQYRVTATVGSFTSASDLASVQTVSTLAPPTPRLVASFNLRNQIELTATAPRNPTGGQLTYTRNGQDLATTTARTLRDSTLAPGTGACYTVRFLDICGNRSADSAPACPPVLTAQAADPLGSSATLSWSALRGPDPAAVITYRLLTLAADGTVLASRSVSGTTELDQQPTSNRQVLRYRLEASGGGLPAGTVSYSNIATVARRITVVLPTAFSPNGDGLNDVLEVKGRYLDKFKFVVVDRNGQEVFRGTDRTQTWDGRVRNNPPVPGAYAWRFEATDETGQVVVQSGTITIVR
ncbi:gliding motility-associated C-terminal domain-containing protein [Hymenobacter sp. GOD-10R]|uniref:T9SS type B sorting domain-containing protein n=1 Tax=Hymenobacter sp. GOD-10R TaxID=3093922 RepID=UPI002D7842EE|nr:gliding motility-associated C-terminal domain-containing protein [Hymenobacter sp. GOD-10R]WRQ26556.1 gliding motility-associated C-terminal domain-containing protein [Hymenobacter sp. GOD-10R]